MVRHFDGSTLRRFDTSTVRPHPHGTTQGKQFFLTQISQIKRSFSQLCVLGKFCSKSKLCRKTLPSSTMAWPSQLRYELTKKYEISLIEIRLIPCFAQGASVFVPHQLKLRQRCKVYKVYVLCQTTIGAGLRRTGGTPKGVF
jgi:hypothetical protein